MSSSGALFDIYKFNDVCRNVIAALSSTDVYNELMEWSAQYDTELFSLITKYENYTLKILSIGKNSENPRKDFACWSDVKPATGYFYYEFFDNADAQKLIPESVSKSGIGNCAGIDTNLSAICGGLGRDFSCNGRNSKRGIRTG